MSLQRDDLAARFAVALVARDYPSADTARFALNMADALLAALVPVAPASGEPATDPRRTVGAVVRWRGQDHPDEEWLLVGNNKAVALKIRKPHLLDCGTNPDGGGDEFVRWATREECERHGLNYVARPLPGAPLAAPSPAAKPWTWRAKPEVGDVWVHPLAPETEVIITTSGGGLTLSAGKNFPKGDFTGVGPASSDGAFGWYYLRRATSSERAAAGLPVDESASESAEADRAFDALVRERDVLSLKHYELFRAGWIARARVAAKGGVA